jgi:hypothetical protein
MFLACFAPGFHYRDPATKCSNTKTCQVAGCKGLE